MSSKPACSKPNKQRKIQVPDLALLPLDFGTSSSSYSSRGWGPPLETGLIAGPSPQGVASKELEQEALGTSLVPGWHLIHIGSYHSPKLISTVCTPTHTHTALSGRQCCPSQLLAGETEAQRICKSGLSKGLTLKYQVSPSCWVCPPCWVSRPDEVRLAMEEGQVGSWYHPSPYFWALPDPDCDRQVFYTPTPLPH